MSCKICNKSFKTKSNLNRHVSSIHRRSDNFLCEFCGKMFNQKANLDKHIQTLHYKSITFICETCNKVLIKNVILKDI